MKRILLIIVVLVGVSGLIALLSFHPKTSPVGMKPKATVVAQASPSASAIPVGGSSGSKSSTALRDGSYTGQAVNIDFGTVQVQAVVAGGKLSSINFLQMPSGGNSSVVTASAQPQLLQEAVQAQSAQVDTVSGATQTSEAFEQSLSSALNQAQA
jgi:uncharacterized protein with FMN-binding domain